MKGLKEVALATRGTVQGMIEIPLYYSIREDKVYTSDGDGRYYVTNLINPNTEEDIKRAVRRWLSM